MQCLELSVHESCRTCLLQYPELSVHESCRTCLLQCLELSAKANMSCAVQSHKNRACAKRPRFYRSQSAGRWFAVRQAEQTKFAVQTVPALQHCFTALHLTGCSPSGPRPAVNRLLPYRSYSPRMSSVGGSMGYFPLKHPLQIGRPSTICGSLSIPR